MANALNNNNNNNFVGRANNNFVQRPLAGADQQLLRAFVYKGRNAFLAAGNARFANDKRVTVSFGLDEAGARRYGPYPQGFLCQFFAYYRNPAFFNRPAGMSDGGWAAAIPNCHVVGAVHEFEQETWLPIHAYLTRGNFLHMTYPLNAPAWARIDIKDVWRLADHLQGHLLGNAILDHFFDQIKRNEPDPAGDRSGLVPNEYNYGPDLINYMFHHQLWQTQMGRAIIGAVYYSMYRDGDHRTGRKDENTPDVDVLPRQLEDIFSLPGQGDIRSLGNYFEFARMLLIQATRKLFFGEYTAYDKQSNPIPIFCGLTHIHPNGEPRCMSDRDIERAQERNQERSGAKQGGGNNNNNAPRPGKRPSGEQQQARPRPVKQPRDDEQLPPYRQNSLPPYVEDEDEDQDQGEEDEDEEDEDEEDEDEEDEDEDEEDEPGPSQVKSWAQSWLFGRPANAQRDERRQRERERKRNETPEERDARREARRVRSEAKSQAKSQAKAPLMSESMATEGRSRPLGSERVDELGPHYDEFGEERRPWDPSDENYDEDEFF